MEIRDVTHLDQIEAILIAAMPAANSSRPKIERMKLRRQAAKLINSVLTGKEDKRGEANPEDADDEDQS